MTPELKQRFFNWSLFVLIVWYVFLCLFLIRNFSMMFDFHLLSLRFFPFVFMMGAFVLWLRIAKHEFTKKGIT